MQSNDFKHCPICSRDLKYKIYKEDNCTIYRCDTNYANHYYQGNDNHELIIDLVIGFDIWYYPKHNKFNYSIGSDPSVNLISSMSIMDLYHKIYSMKLFT